MFADKSRPFYKKILLPFLCSFFYLFFLSFHILAQTPVEITDNIDPNILKQATPSELQKYLKDKNQNQKNEGEDVHRSRLTGLNGDNKISKDSSEKDDIVPKANGPEEVYGSSLFKNTSILELSELSTPPLDYPIGVGDHIVVSLWGGADLELDYIVGRDGSIF